MDKIFNIDVEIAVGLLLCGSLFLWQGIYGIKTGEFIATFRTLSEVDQRPMWQVNKTVARYVGAFLIILGIGCFIVGVIAIVSHY